MIASKDFYYCPKCRHEICYKNCKTKINTKIIPVCTNFWTGGYLDKYEYENRKEEYLEFLCPNDGTVLHSIYTSSKAI